MNLISNTLQIWPIIGYSFSILYSILDQNLLGIYYILFGGLGNELINIILKNVTGTLILDIPRNQEKLDKYKWAYRPQSTNCGYFDKCNESNITQIGFPSGHSQSSFLFATFWSLILYSKYSDSKSITDQIFMYFGIFILYAIAFSVCSQRVFKQCHRSLQIFAGSIVGLILGIIFYYLIKFIMYHSQDEDIYDKIYKYDISFIRILIGAAIISILIILLSLTLFKIYSL